MFYKTLLLSIIVSSKYKAPITVAFIIYILTVLSPLSSIQGQAASPYDSGYDYGCSDAGISDPSSRYINEQGKGPSDHTDAFMNGYNTGFSSCSNPSNQYNEKVSGKFTVNVKVTNNLATDESGQIIVGIDDTEIFKTLHDISFPSKTTVTKTFEFNSNDVPAGKGFSAEVVYGDDFDERADGVNSPSNTPEVLHIYLGPDSTDNDSKFKLNVQVTNDAAINESGFIDVSIDDTNIYKSLDGPFPAKTTVTKTFEFNSNDVPVGKGFMVTLISRDSTTQTEYSVKGVNSPSNTPDVIEFNLGSLNKFTINVQVTNNAATDTYGSISVEIDDPNISKYSTIDLPAKTTVTKTFEFNSNDVPVGKGLKVNLSYGIESIGEVKDGTNSPKKGPEIVKFNIPS